MLSSTIDNDDLMLEILLCLPARALIKFESVNSTWKTLISSDCFRRLHTLHHPKPPLSLLLYSHKTASDSSYFPPLPNAQNPRPYTFTIPNPRILSSCNGLMLLQTSDAGRNRYYVHNPATRQSREIALPSSDEKELVRTLVLAFDPSKSIHYKIVAVSFSKRNRVKVYSSECNTWEQPPEPFNTQGADMSGGVYCDGAVYWKNWRFGVYYDLRTNSAGELPPVDFGGELRRLRNGYYFRILELDGRLHRVEMVRRKCCGGEKFAAVYELHEDRSQWSMKYRCGVRRRFGAFGVVVDLVLAGDEGEEERVLVQHATEGIVRVEELGEYRKGFHMFGSTKAYLDERCHNFYQFGESLAPV